MNRIRKVCCLTALSLAVLGLPSCVVSGGFESVGPPAGDFYVHGGTRYYYPPAYPGYVKRTSVYRHYYGGRYYSHPWWNDARYRSYRHDHRAVRRDDPRDRRDYRDQRQDRRDPPRRYDNRRGDRHDQYQRRR